MPASPTIRHAEKCLICEMPAVGRSEAAVAAAILDHVHYVNAQADRATDPHFEAARLNALVAS